MVSSSKNALQAENQVNLDLCNQLRFGIKAIWLLLELDDVLSPSAFQSTELILALYSHLI